MEQKLGIKLGKRIRRLREGRGLTQAQLASLLLKSVETVSNMERGKTLPGILTAAKLANALGVELKELFDFGEHRAVVRADPVVARITHRLSQMPATDQAIIGDLLESLWRNRSRG
jgi:transcriptional regulator with XRE-family HTH domain